MLARGGGNAFHVAPAVPPATQVVEGRRRGNYSFFFPAPDRLDVPADEIGELGDAMAQLSLALDRNQAGAVVVPDAGLIVGSS